MQEWTLYDRTRRWGRLLLPLLGVDVDEDVDIGASVGSMMTDGPSASLRLAAIFELMHLASQMRQMRRRSFGS